MKQKPSCREEPPITEHPVYCLPSAKGFLFNGPTTTNEAHYKVAQTALPSVSYLDNSQMPGHTVSTAPPPPPPPFSFPSYILFSLPLSLSPCTLSQCALLSPASSEDIPLS
ncbi:unnamed protein product, partial [Ixodes persulcatus]